MLFGRTRQEPGVVIINGLERIIVSLRSIEQILYMHCKAPVIFSSKSWVFRTDMETFQRKNRTASL